MPAVLRRLFRIHEGEEAKVLLFALLAALLQAGVAVGVSVADALFLTHVGPSRLPLIYLLLPFIMAVLTPVFSYLTGRLGMDRLVTVVLATLTIGGLVFYVLLGADSPWGLRAVSYGVKFYASLWFIYLYTLFWNYVDGYFDILDAKRLFSFLTGGMALGGIVGGLLVAALVPHLPVGALFLVWAGLAVVTYPLVRLLSNRYQRLEVEEDGDDEPVSFLGQLRAMGRVCRRSRYVLTLVLLSLCTLFLSTACEFLYLGVFSDFSGAAAKPAEGLLTQWFAKPQSAEELAGLFGKLFGAANVFSLVVTLFVFSRLVGFLGVRTTVLIQPLVYLGTFLLFRGGDAYTAALFGFFAYQGVLVSIDLNNYNFVLNAVPSEAKKEIRTFMEGLLEPVAGSLAGLCLLIATSQGLALPEMAGICVGITLVAVITALLLRRDYVGAMVSNLRRGWVDFARSTGVWVRGLSAAELDNLEQVARHGDVRTQHTALRLVLASDRERALGLVLELATAASDEQARTLMPLLTEMLSGEDDEVVRRVLQWLEDERVQLRPSLVEELGSHGLLPTESLGGLLASTDPEARGAAAVALWHSWEPGHGLQALRLTDELLHGGREHIIAAIRALGRIGQERFSQVLVPYLSDAAVEVRLEALCAIRRLATQDSSRLVPHVLQRIEVGGSGERAIGMDVLAKVADSRCITRLLLVSETFTHFERRRAAQVILSMGQRSVPAVVAVFRAPQYPWQARATAARCLGDLLFAEFEALYPEIIGAELQRAYRYLHYHMVLQQALRQRGQGAPDAAGVRVLSSVYRDSQWRTIEFVLEVLAIGGRLPDYEMIGSALNSSNQKVRGNAIETIEQACTRETFALLLPLVDSRGPEDRLRFYRRRFPVQDVTEQEIVAGALDSPLPLECAAAAQALYEMSGTASFAGFRERLCHAPVPLLRDTINALFARHAAEPVWVQSQQADQPAQSDLNVVEKIAHLSHVPFFGHFGPLELHILARHSARRVFAPGASVYRHGEGADTFYAVLDGSVRLQGAGREAVGQPGSVFGQCCLFGEAARREDAVARSATVLAVDRNRVLADACRYPRLALGLLRARLLEEQQDRGAPAWN